MVQQSLLDQPSETASHSMTAIVAAYFKARPNQVVTPFDLMQLGPYCAWRTEISRCRYPPFNMRIDNIQERHGRKVEKSWYVYTPVQP